MTGLLAAVTIAAALGCALLAGVFFAFSSFVMKALARLQPGEGVAAMQSINIVVINPTFMAAFLGTGIACVALAVWAVVGNLGSVGGFLIAGALLYLVGTIGVTMAFNVPRNGALAKLDPHDPDTALRWSSYVSSWTAGNTVRTVCALLAAAAFIVAVLVA
jgi:uncharacterized membrane protein